MKNKILLFVGMVFGAGIYAQTTPQKVGINTTTPTEKLDVNGTVRVRTLPDHGVNGRPVIGTDTYNVLGKTSKSDMVPNNTNSNFDTTDNSTAMFVIKRYKIGDWPSATGDTGTELVDASGGKMSTSKWEAILSNVGFSFTEINHAPNAFNQNHLHSWQLTNKDQYWKIWGDINGVKEKSDYVDVLFIRKTNVAAEARGTMYPF